MSSPPQIPPHMPLQAPRPTGRRIAALWFPHWAAETSRADYDVAAPFALIDMHKNAQRLVALNQPAEISGLHCGMSLPDARALLPELQTAMADPQDAAARLQKCAYWLQRYTPWIGEDPSPETADGLTDYGLLLDISGCAHLFGGERALLQDLTDRLADYRDGRCITMRAAIAGSIGAAWGLARFSACDVTIVPEGQDAEAVLPLPPQALRLSAAHSELCRRLGLDNVAELARFPRADLTRRFGPEPVLRMEQALGQAGESLNPYLPPPQFMARQNLPYGVTHMDALADLIAELCDALAQQLQAAGQGAQRLDLALTRSDNAVMALSLPLAHPSAEATHMQRLFAERLARLSGGLDAGFGIEQLQLVASRTAAIVAPQENMSSVHQLGGRLRKTAPIAALGGLYDRLVSRLGAHVVVRPVPHASYIPERAVRFASVMEAHMAADAATAPVDPAMRPLFMLCAPEPIEVIAEIPEGAPYRFRWRRVLHEVVAAYGPERIAPEWWDGVMGENPAAQTVGHNCRTRDYYRVEDTQGHRFWLYRDGLYERETGYPRWFMHGVFP
jgi:protein ImuB